MDFSVSHFNKSIFFSNNSLDIRRFVCVSYSFMVLQNGGGKYKNWKNVEFVRTI